MRNLIVFTFISLISFILNPGFVNGQEVNSSMEFSGGVGTSWFSNSTQEEYLKNFDQQFNSNIEDWKTDLNPGLFLSSEFRVFGHLNNFRLGVALSYTQYSFISQFSAERESLGFIYRNEKINARDYKIGLGVNIQYSVFTENNHQISPFLAFGIERNIRYKTRYDQEIQFYLDEEPIFNQFTESSRYRRLDRFYFGRIDLGLNYTYHLGTLSPFAELGGRYVEKVKENEYQSTEDWWAVYINFGLRYHLN